MDYEEQLKDAQVELTAPDGTKYRFTYGASIPYAQETYTVLIKQREDNSPQPTDEVLVTKVEEKDGTLLFNVVEEDDIIDMVYDKYVLQLLQKAVANLPEKEN